MTLRARSASLLVAVCALANLAAEGPESPRERGRRLFIGELSLDAHMVGHAQALPPAAVRCANCHTKLAHDVRKGDARLLEDFGPGLGPDTLLAPLARRGGPPSRFELASFCRAVRVGIDPAHVLLAQAMPQYELNDRDCEALWTYLTTP